MCSMTEGDESWTSGMKSVLLRVVEGMDGRRISFRAREQANSNRTNSLNIGDDGGDSETRLPFEFVKRDERVDCQRT